MSTQDSVDELVCEVTRVGVKLWQSLYFWIVFLRPLVPKPHTLYILYQLLYHSLDVFFYSKKTK